MADRFGSQLPIRESGGAFLGNEKQIAMGNRANDHLARLRIGVEQQDRQ
jgi:hypothetical protein